MPALTPVQLINLGVLVVPRYRRRADGWIYERLPDDPRTPVVLPDPHALLADYRARIAGTPQAMEHAPAEPKPIDDDTTRSRS